MFESDDAGFFRVFACCCCFEYGTAGRNDTRHAFGDELHDCDARGDAGRRRASCQHAERYARQHARHERAV